MSRNFVHLPEAPLQKVQVTLLNLFICEPVIYLIVPQSEAVEGLVREDELPELKCTLSLRANGLLLFNVHTEELEARVLKMLIPLLEIQVSLLVYIGIPL